MPTPVTKETSINHWTAIDGYRFQLGLRELGINAERTMLDAPNLGVDVSKRVHGAHMYAFPLAGDVTATISDALYELSRATSNVLLLNVGKAAGDGALMARGLMDSSGRTIPWNQLITFATTFFSGDYEHAAVSAVGTLANHWAPGSSAVTATANGTAIKLTDAVAADEEILFGWCEPEYPGPTAGSTLTGKLQSATDEIFTTPVDRVSGLGSVGATRGAKSGTVAGALSANLWWRVAWTVTGTTPSRYPIAAFAKRKIAGYQAS